MNVSSARFSIIDTSESILLLSNKDGLSNFIRGKLKCFVGNVFVLLDP